MLLLKRVDARVLLVLGFSMIAIGSWIDTGLTHDWISGDFMPSQLIEAVGLAFAITALITFGVANITPPQAAAIATTIQIARLLGIEGNSAEEFARLLAGLAAAQGEEVVRDGASVVQSGGRLLYNVTEAETLFGAWNALWEGMAALHNRDLKLSAERRGGGIAWSIG